MEIKQLKASLQLAQMRLNSDPSESNQAIYDHAKQAYESFLKSESPKIEQVSGKSENSAVPEDTGKDGDIAGATETSEKEPEHSENPDKSNESGTVEPLISAPSTTDEPNVVIPAAEIEEKKTEDSPAPKE